MFQKHFVCRPETGSKHSDKLKPKRGPAYNSDQENAV